MRIEDITLCQVAKMYRDWLNNFLTVQAFADYYNISDEDAVCVIRVGRNCHDNGF